jgi:Caspase domain
VVSSIELGDRSAMKRKAYLVVAIMVVAAMTSATVAKAAMTITTDRRVALVIGNSAYRNATHLPNTINDANGVAALFRSVGFEVVNSRTDLGVLEFKRAIRDFLITAESADIAVVYYAGHGIEVNGTNYLIPADAKLARDYDVEDEAVALDRIIWALQSVKRLRLILLDACRDNPFVAKLRSAFTRAAPKGGLAKIEDVSPNTLVAYAAKAGSFSYDGDGPNSPFASALIRHVAEPDLDIRIALGRVRDEVLKATGGRQKPFIYGSLGGATIPLVPSSKKIEPAPPVAARESGAPAKPNASLSPVEPNWDNLKLAPAVGTTAPAKVEPPKPPQPAVQAALEKDDPARACIRDEQRLAQLRSNPVPDEIARFQRDLTCTRLQAQVQRLFESVAAAQPASTGPPPQTSGPPNRPAEAVAAREPESRPNAVNPRSGQVERPVPSPGNAVPADIERSKGSQAPADNNDPALACRRDELRLTQLRSNPVPDEIARFQRELSCRQLHAQVQRLFESVATGPPASAPALESVAPAGAIRRSGPVPAVEGRQAQGPPPGTTSSCARDAERLARLREDPTLEAIARFEKELGCEHIRPQLQRLRESIGQ